MQRALGELGLELSNAQFAAHCAGVTPEMGARAVLRAHGRPGDDLDIELVSARASRAFTSLIASGLSLAPGAADALRALAETAPLAIVTRATRREAVILLELFGLENIIACVVAAEDAAEPKPSPALHRVAIARLARRRPVAAHRAIALEDGFAGVRAARDAGLRCVFVGDDDARASHLADAVVPSLAGISPATLAVLGQRTEEPVA